VGSRSESGGGAKRTQSRTNDGFPDFRQTEYRSGVAAECDRGHAVDGPPAPGTYNGPIPEPFVLPPSL